MGASLGRFSWVAVVLLVASCGPGDPPQRDLRWLGKPIYYGDPDTTQAHQAVAFIQGDLGGGMGFACTGTLIAPDVVLTAGHCVCQEYSSTQLSPSALTVGFGNRCTSQYDCDMVGRAVSEVHKHPSYNPNWSNGAPRNDIAVLVLSSAAPASITPIAPLPASLAITQSDVGADLDYVGFGVTESGSMGVKLHVLNALDQVCTSSQGCSYGYYGLAAPNTVCSDQDPGGPCSGDSGGPAFLFRNGKEYVVGVTSYGDQNCTSYGCSTKVDDFESFWGDYVGGANGTTCTGNSQCDSGICVDGVCCQTACNGVCQACNLPSRMGICSTVPNGTACDDGDPCNGTETCQSGGCQAGSPPTCDDQNPCTADSCLAGTGCVFNPYSDGRDCADNDVCNGHETCQGGVCTSGGWLQCDDGNPCTTEVCDPTSGCSNPPKQDGFACDMGACGAGVCQAGVCSSGAIDLCDDANPCTEDSCDLVAGCQHDALFDGYPCGDCQMCLAGQCTDAPDCGDGGGCGCAADQGRASGLGWLFVALLGLLIGRRRRA